MVWGKILMAALVGLAARPVEVSAASYSQDLRFSLYDVWDTELWQFDPHFGRLSSISVDIHASMSSCWIVYANEEPTGASITMSGGSMGFGRVGGVDFNVDMPGDSNGNSAEPHEFSEFCVSSHGSASRTYTTGLEPFVGTGVIPMYLDVSGFDPTFTVWGDGGVSDCHHCGDVRVNATVTYEYSVPEPASWMMMIGGLGLVGGSLRARRASPWRGKISASRYSRARGEVAGAA